MRSLQVINGDLVIEGGALSTVEGTAKVEQDLGLALREPYGGDRFHPSWGSVLDRFIGTTIDEATPVLIEAEARRVVRNYVALQQNQLQQDSREGRPSRYGANEVVVRVSGVGIGQEQDRLNLNLKLDTLGSPVVTSALVGG